MIAPEPQPDHVSSSSPHSYNLRKDEEPVPLAVLLSEINSVAIRLRQRGRSTESGPGNLPGAEHSVLEIIDRVGAITVPQIARERSTSRQNIQILVDRLVAQGRLEFSSNPSHKRSALVQLTGGGRSVLGAGVSSQKEFLAQLEASFSQSEIALAFGILRRIYELLSEETERARRNTEPQRAALTGGSSGEQAHSEADEPAEEFPINLL